MTSKPSQFIFIPKCANNKSMSKIHQQILEISQKHTVSDVRTHARTDACKTYSLWHLLRRRHRGFNIKSSSSSYSTTALYKSILLLLLLLVSVVVISNQFTINACLLTSFIKAWLRSGGKSLADSVSILTSESR